MRILSALSIAILLSVASFAQKASTEPLTTVIWSSNPNCRIETSPQAGADTAQCSILSDGKRTFYLMTYAGITYAMTQQGMGNFVSLSVQLTNRSGRAIEILPSESRSVRFENEADYRSSMRGDQAKALSKSAMQKGSTVVHSGGSIPNNRIGGQTQDQYRSVIDQSGNTRAVFRQPPPSGPRVPNVGGGFVVDRRVSVPGDVYENVLKRSTVEDGGKVAGHIILKKSKGWIVTRVDDKVVYRRPDNEDRLVIYYLRAGSIEFVFPMFDAPVLPTAGQTNIEKPKN